MADNAPINLPIRIERNGKWSKTLFIRDIFGNPEDITAWTFTGGVKEAAGVGSIIANFTFSKTDAAGGQLLVSLAGSALSAVDGDTEEVRLAHDAKAANGGDFGILFRGETVLQPGVI